MALWSQKFGEVGRETKSPWLACSPPWNCYPWMVIWGDPQATLFEMPVVEVPLTPLSSPSPGKEIR